MLTEQKDLRIKFIAHTSTRPIYEALNEGINVAKGTYIARMDADDISDPERLQKQLNYLEKNNLDLMGFNTITTNCNGKILEKKLRIMAE